MKMDMRGNMRGNIFGKSGLLGVLCLVSMSLAVAQPEGGLDSGLNNGLDTFASRFPAGSIQSVEQANIALAAASKTREAILARHAESERGCYTKFIVSPCLDQAKDVRREALVGVRQVEIEADRFKRQSSLADQNKRLEEKRLARELAEPERLLRAQELQKSLAQKELSRQNAIVLTPEAEEAARVAAEEAAAKREAEHEAKLQRQQEKTDADAGKRAKNVAAFEKKQQAAKERQAAFEAKKQQREARNAGEKGSASASASASASQR